MATHSASLLRHSVTWDINIHILRDIYIHIYYGTYFQNFVCRQRV